MIQNLKKLILLAVLVASMGIATRANAAAAITLNPNLAMAGVAGETVEIIGSGGTDFTGATTAGTTIGGTSVTGLTFLDSTHIIVTLPSKTRGSYTVITNGAVGVTFANGITYTAANRTLQVSVIVQIAKNASIAWGTATDADDSSLSPKSQGTHAAGTFAPYIWYVRDNQFGAPPTFNAAVDLGGTYSTDGGGLIFGSRCR